MGHRLVPGTMPSIQLPQQTRRIIDVGGGAQGLVQISEGLRVVMQITSM